MKIHCFSLLFSMYCLSLCFYCDFLKRYCGQAKNVMSLQVGNMKMYCLAFCFYCKDKRGIAGKLSLVLFYHDYNVISLQFGKSLL